MSSYNATLLQKARELKQFAEGEIQEVDLSGFKEISEKRAAALGKTSRKNWRDYATVTEEGHVVNTVNAHTIAVGKVLHALGYRGPFFITKDLKLTKEKQIAKKEVVTIEEIIKAAIE